MGRKEKEELWKLSSLGGSVYPSVGSFAQWVINSETKDKMGVG